MRVLVHDFSGHPFQLQLSRALARNGNEVLHLYCGSLDGMKGATGLRADDPPNLRIEAVEVRQPFERYSPIKRLVSECAYGIALSERVSSFKPEAVLSANTPLAAQALARRAARRSGARFIFWQQDVLSIAMSTTLHARFGRIGALIGGAFRRLERRLLQRSDAVVVISTDYLSVLEGWGLDVSSYHVVENWAPLDELPTLEKSNAWSIDHDLDSRFVFLYSGTLGLKHDPSLLVELADHLPSAMVVVVAEGPGADWLRDRAREQPRDNLLVLRGVPYEHLPAVLASADVLVALLEPGAGVFSVPSKVLSYLCAGRPTLAAVPAENLAHRLLADTKSGVVVEPNDRAGFLVAASKLFEDDALREQLARAATAYSREAFNIERIAARFTDIVVGATPSCLSGHVSYAAHGVSAQPSAVLDLTRNVHGG
jgi:colanic acid biosynthesis glycosyl transferase WcaI